MRQVRGMLGSHPALSRSDPAMWQVRGMLGGGRFRKEGKREETNATAGTGGALWEDAYVLAEWMARQVHCFARAAASQAANHRLLAKPLARSSSLPVSLAARRQRARRWPPFSHPLSHRRLRRRSRTPSLQPRAPRRAIRLSMLKLCQGAPRGPGSRQSSSARAWGCALSSFAASESLSRRPMATTTCWSSYLQTCRAMSATWRALRPTAPSRSYGGVRLSLCRSWD
jgi:hypothetical protein